MRASCRPSRPIAKFSAPPDVAHMMATRRHCFPGRCMMAPMTDDARHAVVAALLRLANSNDFWDRADAGQALATFAQTPGAEQRLHQLLLDDDDTLVTYVTAGALLRREDATGVAAVARALAVADAGQADWIFTAVHDVFAVYASRRDAAVRTCDALIADSDVRLRRGLAHLRDALTEINPLLHPASGG